MIIRAATEADAAAIADLMNHDLATTTTEWSDVPHTAEDVGPWIRDHECVLVAEDGGVLTGFVAYGWFRGGTSKPGYRFTVETSVRVAPAQRRSGVGRTLMHALIEQAKAAEKHVLVAAIDGSNERAIAFHASLGFVEVGRMPELGTKLGRWLDLVLMQLALDDRPPPR